MVTWHVRGVVLPDETVRDFWVSGDRISVEPLPGAETLHVGGYVVPGLVDAHCHPGTVCIGSPLDDDQLMADGAAHVRTERPSSASLVQPVASLTGSASGTTFTG